MNNLLDFIPGFRKRKPWHMVVASIYYLIALLSIIGNFGAFLIMISLPFLFFYFVHMVKNKKDATDGEINQFKEKSKKFSVVFSGSLVCLIVGLVIASITSTTATKQNKTDIADKNVSQPSLEKFAYAQTDEQIVTPTSSPKPTDVPEPTVTAMPTPIPMVKVTAQDLIDDYKNNEVAADLKYKNQMVEATGVIDTISSGSGNTVYVTLNDGSDWNFDSVRFTFKDSEQKLKVAALSKGNNITIQGKCDGKGILEISVKNCTIVE